MTKKAASPKTAQTQEAILVERRIKQICHKYGPAADDIAQQVRMWYAEKLQDPFFRRQQVGYHIRYCKWMASRALDAIRVYDKYVENEPTHILDDDGEPANFFEELVAAPGMSVEEIVIAREEERQLNSALSALNPQQFEIARLMSIGYTQSEIAAKVGISRSSLSHFTARMHEVLREAIAA